MDLSDFSANHSVRKYMTDKLREAIAESISLKTPQLVSSLKKNISQTKKANAANGTGVKSGATIRRVGELCVDTLHEGYDFVREKYSEIIKSTVTPSQLEPDIFVASVKKEFDQLVEAGKEEIDAITVIADLHSSASQLIEKLNIANEHAFAEFYSHLKIAYQARQVEMRTAMNFDEFMIDPIELIKGDGTRVPNLMASVQRNAIHLDRSDILIEPGDVIQRTASNGAVEKFEVIDPGFQEAWEGIPAHYQMEVRKLGLPSKPQIANHTVYNVTGNNARINQSSIDNSTNIVNIDKRLAEQVSIIREAIRQSELSDAEKEEASEIASAIDEQVKTSAPKKSVLRPLLKALPDIATISLAAEKIIDLVSA
jgi:hypothetical protein